MSRTDQRDTEKALLMLPCTFCDEEPGHWCIAVSADGSRYGYARDLHRERYEAGRAIVELLGYLSEIDALHQRNRELRHQLEDAGAL